MTDFGFPEPILKHTELEFERKKYNADFQAQLLEKLDQSAPNNLKQEHVFNIIKSDLGVINPNKSCLIFINGPAGNTLN